MAEDDWGCVALRAGRLGRRTFSLTKAGGTAEAAQGSGSQGIPTQSAGTPSLHASRLGPTSWAVRSPDGRTGVPVEGTR